MGFINEPRHTKCPACGSYNTHKLDFPEGAPIIKLCGSVTVVACAKCGTLSLSVEDKERLENNYAAENDRKAGT